MKSCDEMTADVFRRIGEERTAMKKKRRFAITGVSAICVCLAVIICIGVLPGSESPAVLVQAADLMSGVVPRQMESAKPDERFAAAQMGFAVELFKEAAAESEGENVLVSPLSVQLALAMTTNGANGETLAEMEAVLGLPADELNRYLRGYTDGLPSGDKAKLSIANSVWFRDGGGFTVNRDFLQTNADWYGAAAYASPFDSRTVKDINNWVKKNTDGMIDSIINEIGKQTVMYLINAIAFDGEWAEPYTDSAVRDGTFTAISGEVRDAEMMYSVEGQYLDDGSASGFVKPYAGGQYAFAVLLPNEGVELYDYIGTLTAEGLRETLSGEDRQTVYARMPKFSYDFSAKLDGLLTELGMGKAFDPVAADLTGIGSIPEQTLYIGSVLHKTHITVDELGTKAGAVTAVQVDGTSAADPLEPKEVILDRPFVYMIVDTGAKLPIFMGAVTDIG